MFVVVLKLREHGEASRLREPAVHGRLLAGLTLLTWPAYYAPTLLVNGALHSTYHTPVRGKLEEQGAEGGKEI